MSKRIALRVITAVVCGLVVATGRLAAAEDASPGQNEAVFFKGKTVSLYIGSGTGGSLDQYARLVARHLGRAIPGQPTVVPKNLPGAGGIAVGNYIFRIGPKDGTAIGTVAQSVPFEPLFGGKDSKADFDTLKMHWLGSPVKFSALAVAWHTAPVKTAQDLLSHELVVGSSGVASASTNDAYVLRNLLGFKYRVILGYPSGADIDLAMERGETQGRANIAWEGLKNRNADWLRDKKIVLLYQEGLKRHPDLPDVPLILDFARTDEERQLLELKFSSYELGYPYMLAPETPPARIAALRNAFRAALADPELKAEAAKQRLDIEPVDGAETERILHAAYSAPVSVIRRYEELSKPPSQFETAKPVTVKVSLTAVENSGRSIGFETGGKPSRAVIASGTDVTVGGTKSEAGSLKVGMRCAVTYFGDRGQAKAVHCD
jgi:tripartite-type tricarboxylate transporter receptor subunit TctC